MKYPGGTSYCKTYLKVCGLFIGENRKYRIHYRIFLHGIFTLLYYIHVKAFLLYRHKLMHTTESVFFCALGSIPFVYHWVVGFNEKTFRTLITKYSSTHPHFTNKSITEECDEKLTKFLKPNIFIQIFVPALYVSVGVIHAIYTDSEIGDPVNMVYPLWTPWKIDTPLRYASLILGQTIFIYWGVVVGQSGSIFAITMSFSLKMYYDQLKIDIENVHSKAIAKLGYQHASSEDMKDFEALNVEDYAALRGAQNKKLYNQYVMQDIKEIMERYQNLKTYRSEVAKCVRGTINCNTIMFSIMISTISFTILALPDYDLSVIKMIFACLNVASTLFFCCFVCHFICQMNETIEEAIYEMPWYYMSWETRKVVLNFLTDAQRVMDIKLANIYPINLMFYTSVMKLNYSIINASYAVYKKQRK